MPQHARLTTDQQQALAGVLDEIVPPSADGRLPGAGSLGIAETFGEKTALVPVLAAGLAALDKIAREGGAADFLDLPREARRPALEATGREAPAFLPMLIGLTLMAYYQDGRVREALGLERRPPFPLGYAVPPTDFAILDPVRRRAPFYRLPPGAGSGGQR